MSLDAATLDALKGELESRAATLVSRDAALQKHLRGQDGRNDADFADRVSFNQADEVLEQLDDDARVELDRIRRALERMDAGSYGTCARCGEAIPTGRLKALPSAALCVSCAQGS